MRPMNPSAPTPELLLSAYAAGIFPMAESRDAPDIFWVDPPLRGVLPLDGFRASRSLRRRMMKGGLIATINRDFPAVLEGCAERPETWINGTIAALCRELHSRGHAHSVEVRHGPTLVGGVYGVALGGVFFGESMFSRATDASKVALACLVDRLRSSGFTLFDAQFLTPHLASLGAVEITRAEYHARLIAALGTPAVLDLSPLPPVQDVAQRMTQTS